MSQTFRCTKELKPNLQPVIVFAERRYTTAVAVSLRRQFPDYGRVKTPRPLQPIGRVLILPRQLT